MPKPSTQEVHRAIAQFLTDSRNSNQTFAALSQRLNISVSTLRRVASEYGIVRRPRLGAAVLETIDREREEKSCGDR